MQNNYQPPVSELLKIGPTSMTVLIRDWLDYPEKFGLSKEHIPGLIALAVDDDILLSDPEGTEVWAPLHAWRALAQLKATEAVGPLLKLMNREESDWECYEMFYVISMIGFAAFPELTKFITDESNDQYARCRAIECATEIGYMKWPDTEHETEHFFASLLEKYQTNSPSINSYLIGGLSQLRSVNNLPLIEKIFQEQKVNTEIINLSEIRTHINRPVPKNPFK